MPGPNSAGPITNGHEELGEGMKSEAVYLGGDDEAAVEAAETVAVAGPGPGPDILGMTIDEEKPVIAAA
jgi:hypothetical protein